MIKFIAKLFGVKPTAPTAPAPYKVETPVEAPVSEPALPFPAPKPTKKTATKPAAKTRKPKAPKA
jgi:hypothetical protein